MHTRGLTLQLPMTVSDDEAKLMFAVKLYEFSRTSLGRAARLAGFSKRAFMEILGRNNVPVVSYPADELERELES